MPPANIGRYQVIEPLGAGLLGEALLAREPVSGRTVVLHVMAPPLQAAPQALACLAQQAARVQALDCPGIESVLGCSAPGEAPAYLVTEHLPGGPLLRWLAQAPAQRSAQVRPLLGQVAEALAEAHRAGLFHGDLHPGNLLLFAPSEGPPRALVSGFEVAAVAAAARAAGLPISERRPEVLACRAPEQPDGAEPTGPADVYALGVLLGRALDLAEDAAERSGATTALLDAAAPDGGTSLRALQHRMLAADPALRPTMARVAAALLPAADSPAPEAPAGAVAEAPAGAPPDAPASATSKAPAAGDGFPVQLGQCIGSYRLVGKLGEGGMGVVFDAQHSRLSRRAAVKVLRPQFSRDPDMVARFFTEAESVNVINHPDIVSVYEFGQLPDQTVYIIMEFLEGEPLSKRIARQRGRLGVAGLRLMRHVAAALAAAHDKGIVHRDLKPDNVMIIADPDVPGGERAKVVDFGIAKMRQVPAAPLPAAALADEDAPVHLTRAGQAMGTPLYMSPEQFRDAAAVTDRADVYSFGVMLYEVLTGRTPFQGATFRDIALQHLSSPPPSLRGDRRVPAALAALVERALAKEPAQRPAMGELIAALDALLAPSRMSGPRAALLAVGVTLALGGGAAGLYLGVWGRRVDLPTLRARALLVLREGLRDGDPALRRQAAVLVAQGRDAGQAALLFDLLADRDARVQRAAAAGLGRLGARAAVPALTRAAAAPGVEAEARVQMAGALLQLGEAQGEPVLRAARRAAEPEARRRAALLLSERGDAEARAALLSDPRGDEDQLATLGQLARFGDSEARDALRRLGRGAPEPLPLLAAAELARGDDEEARALLEERAWQDGPTRLQAARLLTELDDPSFFGLFTERYRARGAQLPERVAAAEGLGACGRRDGAPLLSRALPRESGLALRLRIAAAGALLRIAAADPALLAEDSAALFRGALADARWDERAVAALALGDAPPRLGVPLLGQAIRDPVAEVRRSAAHALGRTGVREAIPVLGLAIDDGAVLVRQEVVRSLGQVGQQLRQRGEAAQDALRQVAARAGRGDDRERLVAAAALRRLGERGAAHRAELERWLRSPEPSLRRDALSAWSAAPEGDLAVLREALRDPAQEVRLAAAVYLAERGQGDGAAELQAALRGAGPEAVQARGLLQRLGRQTPGRPWLDDARPELRPAVVAAARYLAEAEALDLLRQGARAPEVRIRLEVIEALGDSPTLSRGVAGRRLLRELLDDPAATVRSRAGLLAGRLGISAAPPRPGRGRTEAPAPAPRPAATAPAPRPAAAADLAPSADLAPADLAPAADLVEPAPSPGAAPAPASRFEQALREVREAFARGDLAATERALRRAQALQPKGHLRDEEWYALRYYQGRLYEAQGRWLAAMGEYDALEARVPRARLHGAQRAALLEAEARAAAHLGRLRVSAPADGRCRQTELWLAPGAHVIEARGRRIEIHVRAGEVTRVEQCR